MENSVSSQSGAGILDGIYRSMLDGKVSYNFMLYWFDWDILRHCDLSHRCRCKRSRDADKRLTQMIESDKLTRAINTGDIHPY